MAIFTSHSPAINSHIRFTNKPLSSLKAIPALSSTRSPRSLIISHFLGAQIGGFPTHLKGHNMSHWQFATSYRCNGFSWILWTNLADFYSSPILSILSQAKASWLLDDSSVFQEGFPEFPRIGSLQKVSLPWSKVIQNMTNSQFLVRLVHIGLVGLDMIGPKVVELQRSGESHGAFVKVDEP